MTLQSIEIVKANGEKARFSIGKLRSSLARTGADKHVVQRIIDIVRDELYQGISTREIYNRAFALLKNEQHVYASRFKLKKAIFELGPTGFPFENFIAALFQYSGYKVEIRQSVQGKCIAHEVDVMVNKNGMTNLIECKFHSEEGRNCDVKIPLYIHSRYNDIKAVWQEDKQNLLEGIWIATNTRFTDDATQYAKCNNLNLLAWSYPEGNSLKDRIDRLALYPITVSTLLTNAEKKFLLEKDVVLAKQLLENSYLLDHLGISESRTPKIINEMKQLCNLVHRENS